MTLYKQKNGCSYLNLWNQHESIIYNNLQRQQFVYLPSQQFKVGGTFFQCCGLTLKQRLSDVRFLTLHKGIYNLYKIYITSSQRCFNEDLTLVRATAKPVGLVKSMDL